jgi:xylulokinase
MREPGNYLGIDIGTGGCKAVVFDASGRQLAAANRDYNVQFTPDGGAELNSDEVMEKCLDAMAASARQVASRSIRALGIASQGEAFTAIKRDGRALCGAMVSSDTRAEQFAREWPDRFGAERLYQITGHTAHPLFTLFKLLWLRERKPEVWAQSAKFLCFEDLLQLRLGLEPAISWPLAGRTMLFDVRRHCWNEEILAAAGVSAEQLARPLASGSLAGTVPPSIAKGLGLADGALVVAGGHDQVCGALGAGITQAGVAMCGAGSVECLTPAFSEPIFSEALRRNNLCTYDHAAPGLYATLAYSLTGGNILKWFREEFAAGQSYEELLKSAAPEPTPLQVLPYWTPSGTPYFDRLTPGAIVGLRLSTTRGEILRALLEGVTLEMRLNLAILKECGCPINELRAVGGGAKSPWWVQLRADILGCPVTTLAGSEGGCLGAAMLACAAHTQNPVQELASRWVIRKETFQPCPQRAQFYDSKFLQYREVQAGLRRLFASA